MVDTPQLKVAVEEQSMPILLTRRSLAATAAAFVLTKLKGADAAPICPAPTPHLTTAAANLVKAYPKFIRSADEHQVVWMDGEVMPTQLYPAGRTAAEKLAHPDLASQLALAYPKIRCALPTEPNGDPGRIRYIPFFEKLYGNSHRSVANNLVRIRWPTRQPGGTLEVTSVNGVADKLEEVASALSNLPNSFHRFFNNPAGGFYWRSIAGTSRLSAHSFGIAVDINVSLSDYWRNELGRTQGEPAEWRPKRARSRIPYEIVDIFENHGFIWGGKWFHYDTMHFEYRPELLIEHAP